MKKNMNRLDKVVRIAGGLLIICLGIYYRNWLGVLGFIPLAVVFVGWCPVYSLLGMNNCPPCDEEEEEKRERDLK